MKKFDELNSKEIIKTILELNTMALILKSLECHDNTSNRNKLKLFIIDNNIDVSHIKNKITREKYNENPKKCKYCGTPLPYEKRNNDFCNHSCSASYNNTGLIRSNILNLPNYCLNCGSIIPTLNKYCNNSCQLEYTYKQYISRWKKGFESGIIGTDNISNHIRRYLFSKYDSCCLLCGWNLINPYTELIPLQIHHIDGNCLNNSEENLLLLCPNCHALTENFGSRNINCTRVDKRIR